jgi:lysophospholipase L1-like esterase
MGDSLTAERGKFKSYVTRLQSLCPQSRFDNYGIGGQMTNQMRRRFGRDVLGQEKPAPDTTGPATPRYTDVLIFGGVNDLYSDLTAHRTNERIQADLAQMYRSAKQAGLRTIALTVAPWGGFKKYFTAARASHTRELNQWIGGQAAPKSSPPLLDVVVETGSLLSCGNPDELCPNHVPPFNDGLHFGAAAHQILAQAIAQAAFPDCE